MFGMLDERAGGHRLFPVRRVVEFGPARRDRRRRDYPMTNVEKLIALSAYLVLGFVGAIILGVFDGIFY